jgi:hypothetical protein
LYQPRVKLNIDITGGNVDDDLYKDQISFFPLITEETFPDIIQANELAKIIKSKTYLNESALLEDRIYIGIIKNVRDTYLFSTLSSPQLEKALEDMFKAIEHYREYKHKFQLP